MIPYGPKTEYTLVSPLSNTTRQNPDRSMLELIAAAFNTALPYHSVGCVQLAMLQHDERSKYPTYSAIQDTRVTHSIMHTLSVWLSEEKITHCVYHNKFAPRVWLAFPDSTTQSFWHGRLANKDFVAGSLKHTHSDFMERETSYATHNATLNEFLCLPDITLNISVINWRKRDITYLRNVITDVTECPIIEQAVPQNTNGKFSLPLSTAMQRTSGILPQSTDPE
jgi:hypothetical protein